MSLNLILKDATGALFVNNSNKPNAPKLEGFAEFALDGNKDGPKLRLDVAAWTKSKDDKPYYSLSFGGLNGAMFPETEKRNEQSPDYTGSLGPNRELRVAGWKRAAEGTGEQYISLLISEPTNNRQQAPANRDKAFI